MKMNISSSNHNFDVIADHLLLELAIDVIKMRKVDV